jgi:hypothetical protein
MTLRLSLIALALFASTCGACAATPASAAPPAADDIAFPQGTWSFQTYLSCAGAADTAMPAANIGAGYYLIDNLSLNVEAAGYGVFPDGPDAGAGELRFLIRHHLLHCGRFSLFADIGEGFFEASQDTPQAGTRFNFVFRAGLGASYQLRDDLYLIGGARYWHLSNAKLEGEARNPALNGVEGYVGLMWTWK